MSNTQVIESNVIELVTPLIKSWLDKAKEQIIEKEVEIYRQYIKDKIELKLNEIAIQLSKDYGKQIMCEIIFSVKEDKLK